jgi:hypothetical protein
MDIKSVKDMKNLGVNGKGHTEDYEAPKYLVKPHEGETLYPFIEKEYLKSKKENEKNDSPFVTTSYKKFIEKQKKNISKPSK